MGYDTKPNLDKSKFEQKNSDILNLSGTTKIYNAFSIESGATLVVKSNKGTGKVLTSNSGGTLTLQDPVGSIVYGTNIYTCLTVPTGITTGNNDIYFGVASGRKTSSGSYNIGLGYHALSATTTGTGNIALGCEALYANTIGSDNVAIGQYSLYCNSTGNVNIAIGCMNLVIGTGGTKNIAIGDQTLYYNSSGEYNIGLGSATLYCNTTGCYNIALGCSALFNNLNGSNNIAMGLLSVYNNTGGTNNIGLGQCALYCNTKGCDNIALGECTLLRNISGNYNIAMGLQSLFCNTVGASNVAIGAQAMQNNKCGSSNIAIGTAMSCATGGSGNIAMGNSVLNSNTLGSCNIALGSATSYYNTSGCNNIALGYCTLFCNTTGCNNIALGASALCCNSRGCNNMAIGFCSMGQLTGGTDNVAMGTCSLFNNKIGNYNIALGYQSLNSNTTGCYNLGIGIQTLSCNTTGSDNIGIGQKALCCNRIGVNNIAIGKQAMYSATGGTSNVAIGCSALYSNTIGRCNVGIGNLALYQNLCGCNNLAAGYQAGYLNITGSSNVFLGPYAGCAETKSNRLHIANSGSRSLISGEFDTEKLCVRGKMYVSGLTNTTKSNVIYYDSSTKELTYSTAPSGGSASISATDKQIVFMNSTTPTGNTKLVYDYTKDALQVGINSCATGTTSSAFVGGKAYGLGSFAIGCGDVFGCQIIGNAIGCYSIALGGTASAAGSIAMNGGATYGFFATALPDSRACGNWSVAMGGGIACGANSVAMARGCTFSDDSVAMGGGCTFGDDSVAMSYGVTRGNCSLVVGSANISCSDNSAVIGGYSNELRIGNSGSVLLGGNNIIVSASTFTDTVIVPNLAIWNAPAGTGNILCWNPITKHVGLTTSGSGGTTVNGITGATNGICLYNSCNVCLGGTLDSNVYIDGSSNYCIGFSCMDIFDISGDNINLISGLGSSLVVNSATTINTMGSSAYIHVNPIGGIDINSSYNGGSCVCVFGQQGVQICGCYSSLYVGDNDITLCVNPSCRINMAGKLHLSGVTSGTTACGLYYNTGTQEVSYGPSASGGVTQTPQALTQSTSTLTWNIANGYNARVTLTQSVSTFNFSGAVAGDSGVLTVIQGGSGSYTLARPSGHLIEGGSWTLSTVVGAKDILGWYYDGTNYFWTIGNLFA